MSVSNSIEIHLSNYNITSHLNLLWYEKCDGVVDIKSRLIRHADNVVIPDELYIKNVFYLEHGIKINLPCHSRSNLAQRIEVEGHILGR
jgi:hypothetical protein